MSDGSISPIEADSASDAIQEALDVHRGLTVKGCYSGIKGKQKSEYPGGYIEYDIPNHKALPSTYPW